MIRNIKSILPFCIVFIGVIGLINGDYTCPTDGFFRDQLDCSVFYMCTSPGTSGIKLDCQPGLYFDIELNVCRDKSEVICPADGETGVPTVPQMTSTTLWTGIPTVPQMTTESTTTTDSTTVSPTPNIDCSTRLYHRHPTDCFRWYFCVEGEPMPKRCANGLNWNSRTLLCERPETVNCNQQPIY